MSLGSEMTTIEIEDRMRQAQPNQCASLVITVSVRLQTLLSVCVCPAIDSITQ